MAIYAIAILIRAAPLDPQCNLKKIWHPKLDKNGQPVFGPDSDPIFGPRFSRWCSGNVKEDQGKSNLRTCTVFSPVTLKSNFSWSCSERLTTFRKWSALIKFKISRKFWAKFLQNLRNQVSPRKTAMYIPSP